MRNDFSEDEKRAIRNWASGKGRGHYRWTCPACSKDRRNNRNAQCLSASVESEKVLVTCWHCERSGAIRLTDTPVYNKPAPSRPNRSVKRISAKAEPPAIEFLRSGISAETAEIFGLTTAHGYFPDLRRETEAVAFPYFLKGKPAGHKLRSLEDKAHICSAPLNSLFGSQTIDLAESSDLIFTEGEIDALSFYEAGALNAVSVPNGASSFGTSEKTAGFLWESKDDIEAAKRIMIATDQDEKGEALANELARRIGKHKCWRVSFPEGCKDANETLLRFGGEVLAACLNSAEPWPVAGLYDAERYFPDMEALFVNGYGARITTGLAAVDEIYSVGPGLLTIVTGVPNYGKTTFVNQLMLNVARIHGLSMAVCSFENPPHVHIPVLAEMLLQKHFFEGKDLPGERMTMEELRGLYPFINRHFKFLQQDDGAKASIESIIERIKAAVFRWGVRGVVIDPYNYIARPANAESETSFIDDMLTQLRLLAQSLGIHIWFIAHTTKLLKLADGSYQPPGGYDISGSAAWYSKADIGLTVHQSPDAPGVVKIVCWKARFPWIAKKGEKEILYDIMRNTYISDPSTDLPPFEGEEF
jgi:twinkle protein